MTMSNIQYTYIYNDNDNEKITSRVIGALGPRPLGGAPGAPGAATPPPEKNMFLFFVSSVSVSGQDIDMEGED